MNVPDSRSKEIAGTLKRCSEETIQAALRFQASRDLAEVQAIVFGVLERELPQEAAGRLATAPGSTRLVEGIGMDSMGMLEAVMSIEVVLGITIENAELRQVATLDELHGFIREKLRSHGA